MQRVTTDVVVVHSCGGDELRICGGGEERVGEVPEEMLEERGDRGDVVVEGGGVAEVDFGGVWNGLVWRRMNEWVSVWSAKYGEVCGRVRGWSWDVSYHCQRLLLIP